MSIEYPANIFFSFLYRVKKWHPDKRRKHNKQRAERKFAEVAEAESIKCGVKL